MIRFRTLVAIACVFVVSLCGLLWKFDSALKHVVGIDPAHSSEVLFNVTTEQIVPQAVSDPMGMFERTIDTVNKNGVETDILLRLKQMKVGNSSALAAMQKTLGQLVTVLSTPCAIDLLLAVENMAAALAYAGSCHLDHRGNASAMAQCFSDNTDELLWAVKLFDAWGKPPSGIASSGPFLILGDYDQCLEILVPGDFNVVKPAQFCRADITAPTPWGTVPIKYGLCAPSTCFTSDLHALMPVWTKDVLGELDAYLNLFANVSAELTCVTKPDPWKKDFTRSEYAFLVVTVTLVVLVITGTVVDISLPSRRNFRSTPLARQRAGFDFDGESDFSDSESSESSEDDDYYLPVDEYFKYDAEEDIPRELAGRCNYQNDIGEELSVAGAPTVALTYKAGEEVRQTFSRGHFLRDIICAFSIRRSIDHIVRAPGSQIGCLHSLRVFNAAWVLIGHAFLLSMGIVGNPRKLLAQVQQLPMSEWILNASLAVDSFFFMAAAVLAFSLRRRLISAERDSNRQNRIFGVSRWLILYFHRGLRLLPAYAFVLGFTATVFNRFGSGPMWDNENGVFGSKCTPNDWWHHLFFMANFYPSECMPWMWYLALDSQFYLAAPLCLFLLHKVPIIGRVFIVGLIVASSVYRFVIYHVHKFPANLVLQLIKNESVTTSQAASMFGLLYATPQARFAPFAIGLLLGWSLAVKKRVSMPHVPRHQFLTFWLRQQLLIAIVLLLGWAVHGGSLGPSGGYYEAFYGSQARLAWALGLALLVWSCERGHLEPIGRILRWSHWIPISRLCFGIYLSHELILIAMVYQRRNAWIVESPAEMLLFAGGVGVFSLLSAVLLAVLVEVPPLLLERKLFMRIRRNIAFRQHDDGAYTVSEAAASEQSLYAVKRRRRLSRESRSTHQDLEADPGNQSLPPALPTTNPETKVMKWLSQTAVHDDVSTRGRDPSDVLSTASTPDANARGLSPLYPWDNPVWANDTREQNFTAIDSTQRSISQRSAVFSEASNMDRTQRSVITPRGMPVIYEENESKNGSLLRRTSSYGSYDA